MTDPHYDKKTGFFNRLLNLRSIEMTRIVSILKDL